MSEKARQRLGDASSLVESFAQERPAELLRFLAESQAPDTLAGSFHRADGTDVPVRFSCLTRSAASVMLSAEVRERTTDKLGLVDQGLRWLQGVTLENYFRLLRVQQSLDCSTAGSRRAPGLLFVQQLERERARLARELHSGAGQLLAAINLHVELIEKQGQDVPVKVREYLERIALLAREAGAEVRAVSKRLHPLDWQSRTLNEALHYLWHNSGIPEKFQGSLTIGTLHAEPPPEVKAAIYRVAQEGLTNAIRHARATTISMSLEERDRYLLLRIEDNGKGFDPHPAEQPLSGGIGLRSIREYVGALGGELHIASSTNGTKLEVSILFEPLDE